MGTSSSLLRAYRLSTVGKLLPFCHNGIYAARQDDDSILDTNPFDLRWLSEPAEKAIRFETDEEGDDYMLCALCEAIFRNAGIRVQE